MNNDIIIMDVDISEGCEILKVLNYDGRDVYILRGVEKYHMEKRRFIAFYDDVYSMYTMMPLYEPDLEKIVKNNYRKEDVLEAISHSEFVRQYFTSFSGAVPWQQRDRRTE